MEFYDLHELQSTPIQSTSFAFPIHSTSNPPVFCVVLGRGRPPGPYRLHLGRDRPPGPYRLVLGRDRPPGPYRLRLGRDRPPGPPSDSQGVSLRVFFFPNKTCFLLFSEKWTFCFFEMCFMCFIEKVSLGQDFSPIPPPFLHSNPTHFSCFSNPLHLQSTLTKLFAEIIISVTVSLYIVYFV